MIPIRKLVAVIILTDLALVLLAFGIFLAILHHAKAASLFNISDTLSTSVPGAGANHTISFTSHSSIIAGETMQVIFDPTTNAFGGIQNITTSTIQLTGATLVSACSGGSNNVTLSTSTTAGSEGITFMVCSGNTVPSGTITIAIGSSTITNPTSSQSYVIRITGTMPDSADTRVAILPGVNVTAAIATNFTFAVSGVATGTTINGVTTTNATASTTLAFGTLSPSVPEILGQQLQVTTNAGNGFAVTIHEDQDLTSSGGAVIHLFSNGNATATPSPWTDPSAIVGQLNTYGHFAVTSNDASGTLFFGTSTTLYAGGFNPTSTLTVFHWGGPADGATQNVGLASVAYKIEISPLQAAGNDYSNNIIYVATPIF